MNEHREIVWLLLLHLAIVCIWMQIILFAIDKLRKLIEERLPKPEEQEDGE